MTRSDARMVIEDPDRARAVAERVLSRPKPKHVKRAQPERLTETLAQKHARVWPLIRAEVAKRVDAERQGRCEWECGRMAVDPHHIFAGARRRKMEAADTVAGICRECHNLWEAGHLATLHAAWIWADDHGFHAAKLEIDRRLSRILRGATLKAVR